MHTLNDPVEYDEQPETVWTPESGFRRALVHGLVAALILLALLAPLSFFLPLFSRSGAVRLPLTLVVAWVLFRTVQRAAGMTGWRLSGLAVALTLLVFCAQHIVYALAGGSNVAGTPPVTGWAWLHPMVLPTANLVTLAALPFCVLLFHGGPCSGGAGVLADVLTMGVWGSRR